MDRLEIHREESRQALSSLVAAPAESLYGTTFGLSDCVRSWRHVTQRGVIIEKVVRDSVEQRASDYSRAVTAGGHGDASGKRVGSVTRIARAAPLT